MTKPPFNLSVYRLYLLTLTYPSCYMVISDHGPRNGPLHGPRRGQLLWDQADKPILDLSLILDLTAKSRSASYLADQMAALPLFCLVRLPLHLCFSWSDCRSTYVLAGQTAASNMFWLVRLPLRQCFSWSDCRSASNCSA